MRTESIGFEIDMYTWKKVAALASGSGVSACDLASQIVESAVDKKFSSVGSTNPFLPDGFNQPMIPDRVGAEAPEH